VTKPPAHNRSVPIFDRIALGIDARAAAWRTADGIHNVSSGSKRQLPSTVEAILKTMADGTPVVLTAKLPAGPPTPEGYLVSNGFEGVCQTVALVTYFPKRQAVRLTPSLGVGWGQWGRAYLTLDDLRDALEGGGRAWARVGVGSAVPSSIRQIHAGRELAPRERARRAAFRESIRIQGMLAYLGALWGYDIWISRGDRTAVARYLGARMPILVERLPMSYDDDTRKIIERIDVIWLKGRSIKRAFEVEHTTPIYSGLLRLRDLLLSQPDLRIRHHIVAPDVRRDHVSRECARLSLNTDTGGSSQRCTFVPYSWLDNLMRESRLKYLTEDVFETVDADVD
jgi:hypothetical protein